MSQLAPDLAKVLAHPEAVRHSAKPVLEILEETFKLRRIVGVGDDSCKIDFILLYLMQTIPWINWGFYICLVFTRILPTLSKRVFARCDEIENSPHARLSEESLLVKVHDPVLVIEKILILLQTELEGSGLVEGPGLGFIGRVHNCLHHSFICCQINWIVCHNLKHRESEHFPSLQKTSKTKCFNWTTSRAFRKEEQ